MAWFILLIAFVAGGFALRAPGETDRRVAQLAALVCVALFLMLMGLWFLGLPLLVVGATLFGIGWMKSTIMDGGDVPGMGQGTGATEETAPMPPPVTGMPYGEALKVLGLTGTPEPDEIHDAHRRMIARAHPDAGGSDYLASKVNEARDVLLERFQ